MVDVCVTQQHGIDLVRFEGEGTSIPLGGIVATLDQTAIEQYSAARHVQRVTRPGDLSRCAEELEFQSINPRHTTGDSQVGYIVGILTGEIP